MNNGGDNFELQTFLPYIMWSSHLAVSAAVAQVYGLLFNLSVYQWRVMATLGGQNIHSASEIVSKSGMSSVIVSRAIKSMQLAGLLIRDINADDKRQVSLRLTDEGEQVFKELVPLVLKLETKLFEGLEENEIKSFRTAMKTIIKNAKRLSEE